MAGAPSDVTESEEIALVDLGIEVALTFHIGQVVRPAYEIGYSTRGSVAIEHFEAETARGEIALDRSKRACRFPRQQAARVLVSVDPGANEIISAEIAHVDYEAFDNGRSIDETCGLSLLRLRRPRRRHQHEKKREWNFAGACESGHHVLLAWEPVAITTLMHGVRLNAPVTASFDGGGRCPKPSHRLAIAATLAP